MIDDSAHDHAAYATFVTALDGPPRQSATGRRGAGAPSAGSPRIRLVCAIVAVLTVVVAAALPALSVRTGAFIDSEVPVYAESVDGWGCHLTGACQDLRPIGTTPAQLLRGVAGAEVDVECALGNFYKLSHPVNGWVPRDSVRTSADPIGCYAGEF